MHPFEVLDILAVAIPRLAMLILAAASISCVVAGVVYSMCWKDMASAKTLWELRDSVAWSTVFWSTFGNEVVQIALVWSALLAIMVSALTYEWWQWAILTVVVVLLSACICLMYRIVKSSFLAWEDADTLLNRGVLKAEWINEERIVRELQEGLLC